MNLLSLKYSWSVCADIAYDAVLGLNHLTSSLQNEWKLGTLELEDFAHEGIILEHLPPPTPDLNSHPPTHFKNGIIG